MRVKEWQAALQIMFVFTSINNPSFLFLFCLHALTTVSARINDCSPHSVRLTLNLIWRLPSPFPFSTVAPFICFSFHLKTERLRKSISEKAGHSEEYRGHNRNAGEGEEFLAHFDTGSTHLLLPSSLYLPSIANFERKTPLPIFYFDSPLTVIGWELCFRIASFTSLASVDSVAPWRSSPSLGPFREHGRENMVKELCVDSFSLCDKAFPAQLWSRLTEAAMTKNTDRSGEGKRRKQSVGSGWGTGGCAAATPLWLRRSPLAQSTSFVVGAPFFLVHPLSLARVQEGDPG